MFQSAHPSASLDTGLHSLGTSHYVNIPNILLPAKANREVLHTEQELSELRPALGVQEQSSLRGKEEITELLIVFFSFFFNLSSMRMRSESRRSFSVRTNFCCSFELQGW